MKLRKLFLQRATSSYSLSQDVKLWWTQNSTLSIRFQLQSTKKCRNISLIHKKKKSNSRKTCVTNQSYKITLPSRWPSTPARFTFWIMDWTRSTPKWMRADLTKSWTSGEDNQFLMKRRKNLTHLYTTSSRVGWSAITPTTFSSTEESETCWTPRFDWRASTPNAYTNETMK